MSATPHIATTDLDSRYADFESGVDLPDPTAASEPPVRPTTSGGEAAAATRERMRGVLAPVRGPAAVTEPALPAPPADPTPAPGPEVTDPEQTLRATSFSVPAALIKQLNTYKDAHGMTTADVLLDALEATESRLAAHLGGAPTHGRFARPSRRGRRRDEGVLAQLHCRLLASNYALLDDLVSTTGATSRSQLVSAALTLYLDDQPG